MNFVCCLDQGLANYQRHVQTVPQCLHVPLHAMIYQLHTCVHYIVCHVLLQMV